MENSSTLSSVEDVVVSKPVTTQKFFFYGTLLNPMIYGAVTGRELDGVDGTLSNFVKVGLNILASEGSIVEGMVVDVDSAVVPLLDAYESIGTGLYKKIKVSVVVGGEVVECTSYQLNDNDDNDSEFDSTPW